MMFFSNPQFMNKLCISDQIKSELSNAIVYAECSYFFVFLKLMAIPPPLLFTVVS